MASNLGDATVEPASRGGRPGWRDPRLWLGILLLAASVVVGARILAASDDTVQVWAAADDMGAGQPVTDDDLVATRVHFSDRSRLDGYFRVTDRLPARMQLTRGVGAGELLPRAAVGSASSSGLLELPIAVDPAQVPGSVRTGSVVDVYVVAAPAAQPGATTDRPAQQGPAITRATVVDAPSAASSFGATTGKRQLVLAVPGGEASAFFALLGQYDDPVLTVVLHG